MSRAIGSTKATEVLDELLKLPANDLRNVIGIAREYADAPGIAREVGMSAGSRLLLQVEKALGEWRSREVHQSGPSS